MGAIETEVFLLIPQFLLLGVVVGGVCGGFGALMKTFTTVASCTGS